MRCTVTAGRQHSRCSTAGAGLKLLSVLQGEVAWKSMNDARFGDLVRQYAARNNAEDAWKAQSEARMKAGEDWQVGLGAWSPLLVLCSKRSSLGSDSQQQEHAVGFEVNCSCRAVAQRLAPSPSPSHCCSLPCILEPAIVPATPCNCCDHAAGQASRKGEAVPVWPPGSYVSFFGPVIWAMFPCFCCKALCFLARMPLHFFLLPVS